MFQKGVNAILAVGSQLEDGYIYRGEYLRQPKHNVIAYDRIPANHIIIFDIEVEEFGSGWYLDPDDVVTHAERLGFEPLPWTTMKVDTPDQVKGFLDMTSVLGGAKVEGIVMKNYERFTRDGKVMMGKYVSEKFKEVHRKKTYRVSNKDIVATLIEAYKTEARWRKAVHHLRDMGELEDSPRDIGKLIKEVQSDVLEECQDEIKEALFKWGWKQIYRGLTSGLPEWYKEQLLEKQFEEE
jgi:hypothetical protein